MRGLGRFAAVLVVAGLAGHGIAASAQSDPGSQSSAPGLSSAIENLRSLFTAVPADDGFLHPDEAFVLSALADGPGVVIARWQIASGYYLYRDKFSATAIAPEGLAFGEPSFDRTGVVQEDEFFGVMEVYHDEVEMHLPVQGDATAARPVEFEVRYQGCAEAGLCYPPITRTLYLELPAAGDGGAGLTDAMPGTVSGGPSGNLAGAGPGTAPGLTAPTLSEQDRILQSLVGGGLGWTVLAFFGFGLLLAFTPCVFPMIPIISSIIVGQGPRVTAWRAFALSLVYVLAVALTYTVAGVLAGLSGANLQIVLQHPAVIVVFAAAFALLSLAMFDVFRFQVPIGIQQHLSNMSRRWRGGTWSGVAVIGVLSALIIGPCVAAPLAGALLYISQSGDAMLGGVALFSMSLGMGVPILVIGASAGRLLPRAGPWMDAVRAVFGVLLLAVAIWLLERVLPAWVTMLMWGSLLIVGAIYLGAFDAVRSGVSGWKRFSKGAGIVTLVYGIAIVIGGLGGSQDPFRPLHGLALVGGGVAEAPELPFQPVRGVEGVREGVARAVSEGRPVMLDFYADWCVSCKEMERYTFSDPAVHDALAGAVLLKVDVTRYDRYDRDLLDQFELFGPPAILFFGLDGRELRPFRINGFVRADRFRDHVEQALGLAVTAGR